ncbi:MAG: hypothetical protein AAF915_02545 [Cyanobacteria bacterium P01_D01_bin.50]
MVMQDLGIGNRNKAYVDAQESSQREANLDFVRELGLFVPTYLTTHKLNYHHM